MVTLILALTLPICCCNLYGGGLECASSHEDETRRSLPNAGDFGESLSAQRVSVRHVGLHEEFNADDDTSRCSCSAMLAHAAVGLEAHHCVNQPNAHDHHGHHDCNCSQHHAKVLTVKFQAQELPSAPIIAFLTWPTPSNEVRVGCVRPRRESLLAPPIRSLLNQHCALNV